MRNLLLITIFLACSMMAQVQQVIYTNGVATAPTVPTNCTNGINYNGATFTCAVAIGAPTKVASGSATFTTIAVASGACQATVTVAAVGTVVNTDAATWVFRSQPVAATDARLVMSVWLTAGNINFARCNPTAASITPTALIANWMVTR